MSVHQSPPDHGPGGADNEGPLAHAARVASEEAYLDGLGRVQRHAWERASGARPEESSKRLLVALSHTIEKAVMSGPIDDPTVVVAMFQTLAFFDREREVYERMAAAGVHVVVGFVSGEEHEPPEGVTAVLLEPGEPLSDEWTVVAVGPEAGAFLVATDQHRFDPEERDYEASRQFVGRWGYARTTAASELARLRFALGDRIGGETRRVIDGLLGQTMPAGGQAAASAGSPGETWATTSLYHMIAQMHSATTGRRELREQLADAQRATAARAAASVDPQSGLTNPDFLQRWSQPSGTTALPIGLALFDVAAFDGPEVRADHRAAYHAARQVAAAMTLPLGPVDAVVRLSAREFLVVVPGASPRHLSAIGDEIGEQLELVSHGYPGVPLRATLGMIVTRARPLPIEALQTAMARLRDGGGAGPVDTGATVDGEHIVVATTELHAEPLEGAHEGRHDRILDPGPVTTSEGSVESPDRTYGPLTAVAPPDPPDTAPGTVDETPLDPWSLGGSSEVPLPRRDDQARLTGLEHGDGPSVFTDLSDPPRSEPPRL